MKKEKHKKGRGKERKESSPGAFGAGAAVEPMSPKSSLMRSLDFGG
jgi:hypothetical protein